jgi:type II secretion system protein N
MIGRLTWPITVDFKKEPLLWVVTAILSFFLFLFLTFPFGALQARILSEITQATGWEVRAAEWSVDLPIGVEWRDVVFSKPNRGSISVESMTMKIGLLAHLVGRHTLNAMMHFHGSTQADAARATGTVTASSWSFQGPTTIKSHAQQIDLALLFKPFVTKGILQADVIQTWVGNPDGSVTFKGEGTWKADIKDLVLERIPVGGAQLPSLTFNRVTLALVCRDAQCEVTEFKGDGPDGSISGQGRLRLQQPMPQTSLELTITVQAGAGWAQKSVGLPLPPLPPGTPLTFKVLGSVANPKLSV